MRFCSGHFFKGWRLVMDLADLLVVHLIPRAIRSLDKGKVVS